MVVAATMKAHTVIIATNEEDRIERAVRSAAPIGPVTVLDGGSTDLTIERARKAGATILENSWPGFAAQRRFALDRITGDWMIFLDADEEITPPLAAEIRDLEPSDASGFMIRRRSLFLGRWMEHGSWGRDRVLRLFRRDAARVEDRRVHEEVTVTGIVRDLTAPMLHYSQEDFAAVGRKFTAYVPLMAREIAARGPVPGPFNVVARAAAGFLRDYVLRSGWRDGWQGFVLAFWGAASVIAKYSEARRLVEQGDEKTGATGPSSL